MARNVYALLVGIDAYPPGVAPLNGCANDISGIETYLQERVQNCQIKTLKNEEATYQAIIDHFRSHLSQAGSEDTALFYYAGHGSQEQAPEKFWPLEPDHLDETLVCYNSRSELGWDLADKELAKLIAEVAAKDPHIVVILDCCHSGSGTRDPLQETAERRAPADTRQRPLESFIVDVEEATALSSNTRDPEAKPAGWDFPQGRHVLLSACRSSETAKEYYGGGQRRGVFSYFLQEALKQTNGNLTYRDLFKRTNALVRSKITGQSPQLEAIQGSDLDLPFLGGAIAERAPYFLISHHPDYGWVMDGGSVHGIPAPAAGETTQLAVFDINASPEQLKQVGNAVATAEVTQVLPQLSKISFSGLETPNADTPYKAVIISLPLPPKGVRLEGEADGIEFVRQAILTAGDGQKPSLYVRGVDTIADAEFRVIARNGEYIIARPADDRPLVAQIAGYSADLAVQVVQRLEHIARWTNVVELASPAASSIPPDAVKLQICQGDQEITDPQMRFEYQQDNSGKWKQPTFKVKLANTTERSLYCALLDLSDRYSISCLLESGGVWLGPKEEAWVRGGDLIRASVPKELWEQGITEFKDIFKLIVSTTEFDPRLLEQDKLDLPRPGKRLVGKRGALNRLMNRVQTRDLSFEPEDEDTCDEWVTSQITITTVRPLDTTSVPQSGNGVSLGGGVTLQPHSGLQAQARLTTVNLATRDVGNHIVPPILLGDPNTVQPFQFTTSRGTDPGLSSLELTDVDGKTISAVTSENPLKLTVDAPLAPSEKVLPIAYDGEFYLPLGVGQAKDSQTEITIERLPEPMSAGQRSLGGSIRIFFQKIVMQKLGFDFPYPLLAVADVGGDDSVRYDADPDNVRARVTAAQRIVLYIHGIIGDTRSMVPSVRHARVTVDGHTQSLADLYDLVLTFDYENLNTSIEDNARLLKQRLEAVGLGAGHGKTLHIVAHSMGGLVSRWFIEQEGGNQIVNHLIMLGTPNAGSPWPNVQKWASTALAIGLNSLSAIAIPIPAIGMLLRLLGSGAGAIETIDVSLDQMQPGSPLLTALAGSPDPGIPYTILAGNTSILAAALQPQAGETSSKLARLLQKIMDTAVALPFFGLPNDIAVTVQSIKSVDAARSPQPQKQEVGCDHLVYFIHQAGLDALAIAVYQALTAAPISSPAIDTADLEPAAIAEPSDEAVTPIPAPTSIPEAVPQPTMAADTTEPMTTPGMTAMNPAAVSPMPVSGDGSVSPNLASLSDGGLATEATQGSTNRPTTAASSAAPQVAVHSASNMAPSAAPQNPESSPVAPVSPTSVTAASTPIAKSKTQSDGLASGKLQFLLGFLVGVIVGAGLAAFALTQFQSVGNSGLPTGEPELTTEDS